jgi:hypothetical protein
LGALGSANQVYGGGYKEGLVIPSSGTGAAALGGAKSYGVSDYPPGFSKFRRRDKREVNAAKRKNRKHKKKKSKRKHKKR